MTDIDSVLSKWIRFHGLEFVGIRNTLVFETITLFLGRWEKVHYKNENFRNGNLLFRIQSLFFRTGTLLLRS